MTTAEFSSFLLNTFGIEDNTIPIKEGRMQSNIYESKRPSTAGFHATRQLSTAITARDSARVATYLPTYLPQHPRLGSRPGTYPPTF